MQLDIPVGGDIFKYQVILQISPYCRISPLQYDDDVIRIWWDVIGWIIGETYGIDKAGGLSSDALGCVDEGDIIH